MSIPKRCIELVREFEQKEQLPTGAILKFKEVRKKDVYNITPPFEVCGARYLAGRVESRKSHWRQAEYDTQAMFFMEKAGVWMPAKKMPLFKLEDPFVTKIKDEIVLGGVEIFNDPEENERRFRTVFYRGKSLTELKQFAEGPKGMKDIRLACLPSGEIGLFTRPEWKLMDENGRETYAKKIRFTVLDSLAKLNAERIANTRVIEGLFVSGEWGGVNEARLLGEKLIGVIGHIAYRDPEEQPHYYAMAFTFDFKKHKANPITIIAARKNFPPAEAKRPELRDVIFPGGIIRNPDGTMTLYAGIGDAAAGKIVIPNPFDKSS